MVIHAWNPSSQQTKGEAREHQISLGYPRRPSLINQKGRGKGEKGREEREGGAKEEGNPYIVSALYLLTMATTFQHLDFYLQRVFLEREVFIDSGVQLRNIKR